LQNCRKDLTDLLSAILPAILQSCNPAIDVFSTRLQSDLSANRLALAVARARADGRRLIDLTESNPTRAGFDYPSDLLAPLADPKGLCYAPDPSGLLDARMAVARDYLRRGLSIDPERIVLTASTSEAYSLLFKVLCDPGDEVLVPRPSYPLLEHLSRLDGIVARPYSLEYHGRWNVDLDSVGRAWSPRTRAMLVVTPNNPTGSCVRASEWHELAAACARSDAALICDEVFADYVWSSPSAGARGHVLFERDVLSFSLGGLSKTVGLPQVKLGWMAIGGPQDVVGQAHARLEVAADTYLSVSTPVQVSASTLLANGAAVRAQIQARLLKNREALGKRVAGTPSCQVLAADGGWSAVVQVPSYQPDEDLVLALVEEDGVLVHPGYFFDFPRETFVIVSLLVPTDQFAEGIDRIFARFDRTAA
jgi:alanine-synthesizing transaminase